MNILIAAADSISTGIINPALEGNLGLAKTETSGLVLGTYIAYLWQTATLIGGLAVIVSLLLGGVQWVMAGGDKGKVEAARERITQTIIGMIVLMASAGVAVFLSYAFHINLLNPVFINSVGK